MMEESSTAYSRQQRQQRVVQCNFRTLTKSQREALMAILCALGDDELTTIHHRAHGEVTLEWRVCGNHPILEVLPEPTTFTAPRALNTQSRAPPRRTRTPEVVRQDDGSSTPLNRVLREGRPSGSGAPSPRGRNVSPAAAAARRGAAARNRSLSPQCKQLPASPLRSSTPDKHPHRSAQWSFRTIDEIFAATRKLRLDTTRTSTVEELTHHVLANRYGVSGATRRMYGELCTAAQQYADASPLCMVYYTYCSKRSTQDLKEFVLLAKIVGALAPWSTKESVRTAAPRFGGNHNVSGGSHPSALLPPRPHTQGELDPYTSSHVVVLRRYISEGDLPLVLRDALAAMLRKGSTLASETRRYVTQWVRNPSRSPPIAFDYAGYIDADVLALVLVEGLREAKAAAQRLQTEYGEYLSAAPVDDAPPDEDDDASPSHSRSPTRVDGMSFELPLHHSSSWHDAARARRFPYQSEDLVDVMKQRRLLEDDRAHIMPAARHPRHDHRSDTRPRNSPSRQHGPPVQALAKATKSSPLVVSLPPRQPNHSELHSDPMHRVRAQTSEETDVMGSLMARRDEAIAAALTHELKHSSFRRGDGVDASMLDSYSPIRKHSDVRSLPWGATDGDEPHSTSTSPPHPEPRVHIRAAEQPRQPSAKNDHLHSSPLAHSPYQADLSDMRSTLQAIEDELRRRQDGGGQKRPAQPPRHYHHQAPALVSPPRPQDAVTVTDDRQRHHAPQLSPSRGLEDDERLLLEQLELSLRARKQAQQGSHAHPPTPRRPLEVVADPL